MRSKKIINLFCLSGVISAVFYLLHDVIGAMHYPNYDRMSQAVSDLTALSAPSFVVANGLVSVYTVFSFLCTALICILIQDKGNKLLRLGVYLFAVMNTISAIGFSLFPLTESGYTGQFQDLMHLVVVALVVLFTIASLIPIIIGSFKLASGKSLATYAIITLLCTLIGGIGVNIAPSSHFGFIQRFANYSIVIFTAILGLYGFFDFSALVQNSRKSG